MRTIKLVLTDFCLLCCLVCFSATLAIAVESPQGVSLDQLTSGQVDSVLAKLSDEQVRTLLIEELRRDVSAASVQESSKGGVVAWLGRGLHLLDGTDGSDFGRNVKLALRNFRGLPDDFNWVLRQFSSDFSRTGAWKNLVLVLGIFCLAFLVELLFRAATGGVKERFRDQIMPDLTGMRRFLAAVLYQLPALVHLILFAVVSLLLYFWSPAEQIIPLRYFFLSLLFCLLGFDFFGICRCYFVPRQGQRLGFCH